MLELLLTLIATVPPDPRQAAADALRRHDYRIAGVTGFWVSRAAGRTRWRPYGLRCRPLPDTAYAYGYFVSDAIGREAFDGYRRQKRFLLVYNRTMLDSGRLPHNWGCVRDLHPEWPG